jgi:transcriptional regulator with XRE-family HTH domain
MGSREPADHAADDGDSPARRLGRKLREARVVAGYRSQDAFAAEMNTHRTTITKIENGTRHVTPDMLRQWCQLCHVDFELYEASARLAWVTEISPVPDWFQDFFKAQTLAHTIRTWHPFMIPGLLQTADYARALHLGGGTSDALIEERIAARLDLQQRTIERRPVPATLLAVMDELALHRQVGSPEVRRRQLLHLIEQGQRWHVGIQVVPAIRGANAGQVGAFTVACLDDADVMLMETVEDVTTDKRPTLRTGLAVFDRIRLDALSGPESLELIAKVAEGCKP